MEADAKDTWWRRLCDHIERWGTGLCLFKEKGAILFLLPQTLALFLEFILDSRLSIMALMQSWMAWFPKSGKVYWTHIGNGEKVIRKGVHHSTSMDKERLIQCKFVLPMWIYISKYTHYYIYQSIYLYITILYIYIYILLYKCVCGHVGGEVHLSLSSSDGDGNDSLDSLAINPSQT